jgi:hypothetical protein
MTRAEVHTDLSKPATTTCRLVRGYDRFRTAPLSRSALNSTFRFSSADLRLPGGHHKEQPLITTRYEAANTLPSLDT